MEMKTVLEQGLFISSISGWTVQPSSCSPVFQVFISCNKGPEGRHPSSVALIIGTASHQGERNAHDDRQAASLRPCPDVSHFRLLSLGEETSFVHIFLACPVKGMAVKAT